MELQTFPMLGKEFFLYLQFYANNFDDGNIFLFKKSLTYFVDADRGEMANMMESVEWGHIKMFILNELKNQGL